MSKPGDEGTPPEQVAFKQLEGAVALLLSRLSEVTARAETAEARSAELSTLVQRFTGDEDEAGRMLSRLKRLESENEEMRSRLDRGRTGVERMIARIRFLENQG